MPDKHLPFMMAAIATAIPGARVNVTRIIEAIVISCVCAMATSYVTTKILETKMDMMERTRQEDRTLASRDRVEIKQDIARIQDMVEDHILMKRK